MFWVMFFLCLRLKPRMLHRDFGVEHCNSSLHSCWKTLDWELLVTLHKHKLLQIFCILFLVNNVGERWEKWSDANGVRHDQVAYYSFIIYWFSLWLLMDVNESISWRLVFIFLCFIQSSVWKRVCIGLTPMTMKPDLLLMVLSISFCG